MKPLLLIYLPLLFCLIFNNSTSAKYKAPVDTVLVKMIDKTKDSTISKPELINTYIALSNYFKDKKSDKYALEFINRANDLAVLQIPNRFENEILNCRLSIYLNLGNFNLAFQTQRKLNNLKDSLNKISFQDSISKLNEVLQRDREKLVNKSTDQINNSNLVINKLKDEILIWTTMLCVSIFVFLLIILIIVKKKSKNKLVFKNEETDSAVSIDAQKIDVEIPINESIQKTNSPVSVDKYELPKDQDTSNIKLLHQSMIPTWDTVQRSLHQSFVFQSNKTSLSSNVYWFDDVRTSREKGFKGMFVALAKANGVGHNPTINSILISKLLSVIIKEKSIFQPGAVLHHLNNEYKLALNESRSKIDETSQIALCSIDQVKNEIHYAGSKLSLFIVRNEKIFIIKPEDFFIGGATEKNTAYKNNVVDFKTGDIFYLISESYSIEELEQIKSKLLILSKHTFEDQKIQLTNGDSKLTQSDDFTLIGFKL